MSQSYEALSGDGARLEDLIDPNRELCFEPESSWEDSTIPPPPPLRVPEKGIRRWNCKLALRIANARLKGSQEPLIASALKRSGAFVAGAVLGITSWVVGTTSVAVVGLLRGVTWNAGSTHEIVVDEGVQFTKELGYVSTVLTRYAVCRSGDLDSGGARAFQKIDGLANAATEALTVSANALGAFVGLCTVIVPILSKRNGTAGSTIIDAQPDAAKDAARDASRDTSKVYAVDHRE